MAHTMGVTLARVTSPLHDIILLHRQFQSVSGSVSWEVAVPAAAAYSFARDRQGKCFSVNNKTAGLTLPDSFGGAEQPGNCLASRQDGRPMTAAPCTGALPSWVFARTPRPQLAHCFTG